MSVRPAIHPGPGSMRLLACVGRLGVAGIEPVRLMLGVSQAVAYSHVDRLRREGLLMRVRPGDGAGGVVAITRKGAARARAHGAPGVAGVRTSAPSLGRHGRAVSWVAASLELRQWKWLGPAELRAGSGWRAERDDGTRHSPDLGMVDEAGRRTAIEVELQPKSRARLPRRCANSAYAMAIRRKRSRTTQDSPSLRIAGSSAGSPTQGGRRCARSSMRSGCRSESSRANWTADRERRRRSAKPRHTGWPTRALDPIRGITRDGR